MAEVLPMSDDEQAEHMAWVASRPDAVRAIAERFWPNRLYRLKPTGQRVVLLSISDDGTVTIRVLGAFNLVTHERDVFGVNPDDLEECDLPDPDEIVGCLGLTEDEVRAVPSMSTAQQSDLRDACLRDGRAKLLHFRDVDLASLWGEP